MPEETMTVIPHLTCSRAAEAVEFYKKAFGAEATFVMPDPQGRIMHASLKFGNSEIYVNDEFPDHNVKGPLAIGGTPVTLYLKVADCDAAFAQAVEAGCTVLMPLEDQFWGDRFGLVADPYGHQWSIATPKREVSKEELEQAIAGMGGEG